MKKQIFLLGAAAALLTMGSCSSSDDGPKNPSGTGEAVTSFMAVNIVQPNEGTRADAEGEGTQWPNSDPDNATYEEGFAAENAVTKVRFYFFDSSNNGVNVHYVAGTEGSSGSLQNFVDVNYDNTTTTSDEMPNVEKILSATIVLNTKDSDKVGPEDNRPTQVVAVINPYDGLGTVNSISDLQAKLADYASSTYTTSGSFVMANSVYQKTDRTVCFAVDCDGHFYDDRETAIQNPVDIYVERAVAKARVTLKIAEESSVTYPTADGYTFIKLKGAKNGAATTDALKFGNTELFLKLANWDVTCTANEGYLAKNLTFGDNYPTSDLWTNWTYSAFFRSYWAQNPTQGFALQHTATWKSIMGDADNNYTGNNSIGYGYTTTTNSNNKTQVTSNSNIRYINENAPGVAYSETGDNATYGQFTKVLIPGQLVDASGNPVTVIYYAGSEYTNTTIEEGNETKTVTVEEAFKNDVLNKIRESGQKFYKHVTADGSTTIKEIDTEDIEFVTAANAESVTLVEGKEYGSDGERYYVYAHVKDGTYYPSNEQNATAYTTDQVKAFNKNLETKFGRAKIWKNGMTYYYITLKHLGTPSKVGEYGVVRNHIYDCEITGIAGFGTPVYDPDEIIYPEKPGKDDYMLAARIRILSWRVVKNSYSVAW